MDRQINIDETVRDIVVVGASAGGIEAVRELLLRLPTDLPATLGIVIHRAPQTSVDWAELVGKRAKLTVLQAVHGSPVAPSVAYVAPADHHMTFGQDQTIELDQGAKQHHMRPSVNALFVSAATVYGPRVLGIVLTGGGSDGTEGLRRIHTCGGIALVQSLAEAEFAYMPEHALLYDHAHAALSIDELGGAIIAFAHGKTITAADPHELIRLRKPT